MGLVDEGSTLGSPDTLMMSGAWPPPEPSGVERVDGAALERGDRVLDESRFVQRVGVLHTCTSICSATVSAERSTAASCPSPRGT